MHQRLDQRSRTEEGFALNDDVIVLQGDCLDVLRSMPPRLQVDAIVTDPPYGLSREPDMVEVMNHWLAGDDYTHRGDGFMGKSWDSFVPGPAIWRECYARLKPGGHLLAFGGTRTYDLLMLAIRLAGFEIRDSIHWIYGSGFPKSLDVSKAIDGHMTRGRSDSVSLAEVNAERPGEAFVRSASTNGHAGFVGSGDAGPREKRSTPATDGAQRWHGWGTALKPAHEPIVVARKPLARTVAANVLQHGTGALNIDACRVGTDDDTGRTRTTALGVLNDDGWQPKAQQSESHPRGRWPSNVVLDDHAASEMDAQTGILTSGQGNVRRSSGSDRLGNTSATYGAESRPAGSPMVSYGDSGGASRFFPVFKYQAKAPTKERPAYVTDDGRKIAHPTCKPLDLMRWLVRLVTPPGGIVLDPFAGSGATAEASLLEGFRSIMIEREPEYLSLIQQRVDRQSETITQRS